MTTFKKQVHEVAEPLSQGEKNFKAAHAVVNHKNLVPGVTDQDHVFNGSTKPYDNKYPHSYKPGEDVTAYDKNLTIDPSREKLGYEGPQVHEEEVELEEKTLSAKAARAGKDIGAPGKNFAKIAKDAAKRYGSKEAGEKVAGAVLKKMRANEEVEQIEEMPSPRALGKGTRNATIDAASKNSKFKGMKNYRQPGEASKAEKRAGLSSIPGYKEALAKRGLKEAEDITDDELFEAMTKSSTAGDWIHDFVHSDNPKFEGKSRKERQKMALAAYYAKQNEEVEQANEGIIKGTASLVKHAVGVPLKTAGRAAMGAVNAVHAVAGGIKNTANDVKDASKKVKKAFAEDYDYDYEGAMAKTELKAISDKASKLAVILSDDTQLEAWVQSKISKAKDHIDAVYDYMMYSDNPGPKSDDDMDADTPMVAVAPVPVTYGSFLNRMGEEVESVDEALGTIASQKAATKFSQSNISKMDREEKARKASLSPRQKKIAAMAGDPDKIDADDLAALRASKKMHKEEVEEITLKSAALKNAFQSLNRLRGE